MIKSSQPSASLGTLNLEYERIPKITVDRPVHGHVAHAAWYVR